MTTRNFIVDSGLQLGNIVLSGGSDRVSISSGYLQYPDQTLQSTAYTATRGVHVTTGNAAQVVDYFSSSFYSTAKYLIQCTGANVEVKEITVINSASGPTLYQTFNSAPPPAEDCAFSVVQVGGDIQLLVTPFTPYVIDYTRDVLPFRVTLDNIPEDLMTGNSYIDLLNGITTIDLGTITLPSDMMSSGHNVDLLTGNHVLDLM